MILAENNFDRSSAFLPLILAATVLFPAIPSWAAIFQVASDADVRMVFNTVNSRDDNNGGQDNPLVGLNTASIDNFTLYGFDLSGLSAWNVIEDATLTVVPNPLTNANHGTAEDFITVQELFATNAGWSEGNQSITGGDNLTDNGSASFLNFAQYNEDPGPPSGTSIPWKDAAGTDASNLFGAMGPVLDTEPGYAQGNTPAALTFNISQAIAQDWVDNGLGGLVFNTIDNGDSRSRFQMGLTTLIINAVDDQPTLEVNTTTGAVSILNDTVTPFDINFYEIISPGGALAPGTWNSFQDQDLEGSGPPNNAGDGWEELGTPHDGKIAEAFLQGGLMLGSGDSETLGAAFDYSVFGPNADGDLQFNIGLTDDSLLPGIVVYVTAALPGDFDSNGVVNGKDFLKWQRDGLGAVELADWGTNYAGPTTPDSAAAARVPEPNSWLILASLALAGIVARRP